MAKDDYHVIVYQILAYLYQCLKKGENVDTDMLKSKSPLCNINERYWAYVIRNMVEQGFIAGVNAKNTLGSYVVISMEAAEITPKGIEYLNDNSFIQKAKEFAMSALDVAPILFK